ncbi:unnamed protein product [Ceutorhynchus assimilis]|uniref:Uncharacterized protein n=1 Tax=Ceutorhynchus assimilis TaxID=467358 RepID=A0A9N9MTF5_9CUCU|nr:unnamed protein product [Ceutorhynchus assimilis]
MNKEWANPPPPGTEYDDSTKSSASTEIVPEKSKVRSRSRSRSRHKRRNRPSRWSRSRSREYKRRSRSRSRRRRRRYSSSSSTSSSVDYHRHRNDKYKKRGRYSRSKSRDRRTHYRRRSRSRSRSPSRSHLKDKRRSKSKHADSRRNSVTERERGDIIKEEDMKIDEDVEEDEEENPIPFKNDGSFLEMFKKMQEEKAKEEPPPEVEVKKPVLPMFGKRRGGKVLKTGIVAKLKNPENEEATNSDAWAMYMREVRRYKEEHCDDDSKTRPLVK